MRWKGKAFRDANKEHEKQRHHVYRAENKEKIDASNAAYRAANREKIAVCRETFRGKNRNRLTVYYRDYRQNRRTNDLNYRLADNLRGRLYKAIRAGQKTGSAIRDLGCTIEELKVHLERQFQPGMTWDNHSAKGWHIDHIIPLSAFDLTNRDELLKAVHYTNLQPLWWEDNLRKKDRLPRAA